MQQKAFVLAQKWIDINMKMYDLHGHMWEKYDVSGELRIATGGEYTVQVKTDDLEVESSSVF